jgi:predicted GIY-YIG superfamily endonuclease
VEGLGARFVYILRSDSDPERHYVGRTANVDERLAWHNNGPCSYTRRHRLLLVGAGLFVRTVRNLEHLDLGFDAEFRARYS